jgi:hypothetical protein
MDREGLRVKTDAGDTIDVAPAGPEDNYVTLRLESARIHSEAADAEPLWVLLTPDEAARIGDALKRAAG